MLVYILLSPSNSTYHTIFWLWYVYYFLSLYKFVIYVNIYIDIGTTLQVKLKVLTLETIRILELGGGGNF